MANDIYFGYHLILDCKAARKDLIKDPKYIVTFTELLVESIKMKAYGKPIIENFAHDNPKTGGITLVQLIETSNITCHFVELTGDMYWDIFSCMEFNPEIAINLIDEYFKPIHIKKTFMNRQA